MTYYQEMMEAFQKKPLIHLQVIKGKEAGLDVYYDGEFHTNRPQEKKKNIFEECIKRTCSYPFLMELEGNQIYMEKLLLQPLLVVCGTGHVAEEVCRLAEFLEMRVEILDDREDFLSREAFSFVQKRHIGNFSQILRQTDFPSNAYYVIVTRGHRGDLDCLREILKKEYGYVGMIGSRSKVAKCMTALKEEGVSEQQLSDVYAPIGLEIGSQTPKEIAVSIFAQLIQIKNRENIDGYLDTEVVSALKKEGEKIIVQIVEKQGSAPRGVGSRMIIDHNGEAIGTIGGGKVEYEAILEAKKLLREGSLWQTVLKQYELKEKDITEAVEVSNKQSSERLGMWCSGRVCVFFQKIV